MNKSRQQCEIEALERAFWQSMVEGEPEVAAAMLHEPALMVSAHGVNKFGRQQYERMANDPRHRLVDFTLSDMDVLCPTDGTAVATYRVHQVVELEGERKEMDVADSSMWVKIDGEWKCVAHTESVAAPSVN